MQEKLEKLIYLALSSDVTCMTVVNSTDAIWHFFFPIAFSSRSNHQILQFDEAKKNGFP